MSRREAGVAITKLLRALGAVGMGLSLALPLAGATPAPAAADTQVAAASRPVPVRPPRAPRTPTSRPQRAVCGAPGPGRAQCFVHVLEYGQDARGNPTPKAAIAPSGLSPDTLKSVYGFSTSPSAGAGQTVAVVDSYNDPTAASDLQSFSAQYGLPSCTAANGCFHKVNQDGGTSYPATDSGWALEISLDVQWVHAIAPGARILLVEASDASFTSLMAAEDYASTHARYVSNSWGAPEFASETGEDVHFSAGGVSYFVAAGDNGLGPEYPSVSPGVISVGGTSLLFDSSGAFVQETAWSNGGGGCSAYERATPAQAAFATYPQVGCAAARATPDVALDADPNSGVSVYDSTPYSSTTGWWSVGGTSAATPMWAARSAESGSAVQTSTVYGSTIPFRDITSGNNGAPALVGYDLATGRGSWVDGSAPSSPGPSPSSPPSLPGPPSGLVATGMVGSVSLRWTAPSGSTVSSYDVERGTSSGAETLLASGVTSASYQDTTAAPGQLYFYEVKAVNSAGTSGPSNEASATASSAATGAPVASFTTSCSRATCTFTSTSTDAGASITSFAWSGSENLRGSTPTIEHRYWGPGSYTVALAVGDSAGSSATTTGTVTCAYGAYGRLMCG